MHRQDRLLALAPPIDEERVALLDYVQWWRRVDWDRVAVGVIAGFFVWLSLTLMLAPTQQVLTQGSRPAFDLAPPHVWAWGFLLGGVAATWLAARVTGLRQAVAWFLVAPAQTVWLGASVMAVLEGGGSAIGVVLWSVVLAFTALTAIRLAIAFTSGKR